MSDILIPKLNDPNIIPVNEVLLKELGKSFKAYEKFISLITNKDYCIVPEWRYYNDGKAWLCKNVFKKKTVFWLSVWDSHFKVSFYFTEKNCQGIDELEIDERIKEEFGKAKSIGKLIPLTLIIEDENQVEDALKIIQYKKSLK